jgi:hypothetical protein
MKKVRGRLRNRLDAREITGMRVREGAVPEFEAW